MEDSVQTRAAGSLPIRFLTAAEVAEWLGISVRTVYALVDEGLPAYRLGRLLRFDPDEVSAHVRQHRIEVSSW